jgi:hypothetical protein
MKSRNVKIHEVGSGEVTDKVIISEGDMELDEGSESPIVALPDIEVRSSFVLYCHYQLYCISYNLEGQTVLI